MITTNTVGLKILPYLDPCSVMNSSVCMDFVLTLFLHCSKRVLIASNKYLSTRFYSHIFPSFLLVSSLRPFLHYFLNMGTNSNFTFLRNSYFEHFKFTIIFASIRKLQTFLFYLDLFYLFFFCSIIYLFLFKNPLYCQVSH